MRAPSLALLAWTSLCLAALLLPGCDKPLVQVVPARVGAVESTATSVESGLVKARRDSSLSPPVSGRIIEIFHKKGDRLKALDAIVRLENDLELIARDEAEMAFKRMSSLKPSGAAAEELLDQTRFALDRARINYERTFVRAPFDGVLVELNANLGEMIYGMMPLNLVMGGKGATEKPMARVVDDSQLYVEADIDEADVGRLRPGLPTRVTLEALGGRQLPGRLVNIGQNISIAEGRSRTVLVEIEILAPARDAAASGGSGPSPPELMVGMSADIEVVVERAESVVRVPTLTVLEGEAEKVVWVVEGGRLERRPVEVGAANWELTEIKKGVQAGEQVVVPIDRRLLVEGKEVRTELRAETRATEPPR